MKKIRLVIVINLLLVVTNVLAQNITPIQLKEARMAVYDWVRDYNIALNFKDKRYAKRNFRNLFENGDCVIYNEYFSQKNYDFDNQYTTVNEYIDMRMNKESFYEMTNEISEVEILKESIVGDGINFSIRLTKSVSFAERDRFDSNRHEYPNISMRYEINLVYDFEKQKIKAQRIHLLSDELDPFLIVYPDNEMITKDRLIEKCNNQSDYLVYVGYECNNYFDDKIANLYRDTIKNKIGIVGNLGLGVFNTSLSEYYSIDKKIAYNGDFGVNYYRQIYLKDMHRVGVDVGARYRWNKYNIMYNGSYRYDDIDWDGGKYQRIVDIYRADESINNYSLSIPIDFRYDYFINKRFSVFSELGVEATLMMKYKSKYSAITKYGGYYDWLFDVVIDQKGIYDFGEYEVNGNLRLMPNYNFGFNIYAGVGCSYFVSKRLSIDAGIVYNTMIYNTQKNKNLYYVTRTSSDWQSIFEIFNDFNSHLFNLQIQINYNF